MEEQSVPEDARCPECGGEPVASDHTLFAVGYLDDEIRLWCENDHTWLVGVPIGEWGRDIWSCDSCDGQTYPHELVFEPSFVRDYVDGDDDRLRFKLLVKCGDCNYTTREEFRTDERGVFLFGYSSVTGYIDGVRPRGWMDGDFDRKT